MLHNLIWIEHLTFSKLRFTLRATQPLLLPEYKGSTFRGAFGNQFKQVVCINMKTNCEHCILKSNCVYSYVFETPNNLELQGFSSPKLPQPYILEPPASAKKEFSPGEYFKLNVILIGKAIDYLPYFIFVFDQIGIKGGIGKNRERGAGRFELLKVEDELNDAQLLYANETKVLSEHPMVWSGNRFAYNEDEDAVTLTFITPTRIKHFKNYLLFKKGQDFDCGAFLENIYRRGYLLTLGHCDGSPENIVADFSTSQDNSPQDFSGLQVVANNLYWHEWQRYSSRQDQKHPFGGFVGQVKLTGDLHKWLPLFRLGEMIHVGNGTTFGLGKYVIS